ncbi:MAG: hypothetical protein ACREE2_07150 [Stellaceae bacterium]
MQHDISRLQTKLDQIDASISLLAGIGFGGILGGIIHKPGWTTIAEFALVELSLETILDSVNATAQHCEHLIQAADKISDAR